MSLGKSLSTGKLVRHFRLQCAPRVWTSKQDRTLDESDSEDDMYMVSPEDEEEEEEEEEKVTVQKEEATDLALKLKQKIQSVREEAKVDKTQLSDTESDESTEEDEEHRQKRYLKDVHEAMFQLLNNYRFIQQLRTSSFHVYEVVDPEFGTCVLKIGRQKSPSKVAPKEVRCMVRCAEVPGVIKLLRWHETLNNHYALLMPMVEDHSLDHVIGNARKIRSYMRQLLTTLHECQKCGVFHRDIKPGNIFWNDETEFLTLADFDIATLYPQRMRFYDAGTDGFHAPEMASGKGYTCMADVYSAGIVFGMLLHEIDDENEVDDALISSWRPQQKIKGNKKARRKRLATAAKPTPCKVIDKVADSLLQLMLEPLPSKRATLEICLQHPYFA